MERAPVVFIPEVSIEWANPLQAKAAAEAEQKRQEEAAKRAQMQQEAQERLKQLEEEERIAEEKFREGLDLEEGETLSDRALRKRMEQERQEREHPERADASNQNESVSAAGQGGNMAGLTSEEYRKQLREVELRVCAIACTLL
jgi:hypothetical protein